MKIYWRFILTFVFFIISSVDFADSNAPQPAIAPPTQKSSYDDDIKIVRQKIEMDLLGDGKTETFKTKTITHWDANGGADYSEVIFYRVGPEGGQEAIWKCRYPEIVKITVEASPLDPLNPKESFLILNCAYGALVADTHVYHWDGKTFQEVENGGIHWAQPQKMKDGVNVLFAPAGVYGDEGPDIYAYRKNFMVPCNYQYPEVYQKDIEETLRTFGRRDWDPSSRIMAAMRGLMRFLYGGRVKEGIYLYDRIWKLADQLEGDEEVIRGTVPFRAGAYLEMGQKQAASKELWKWAREQSQCDADFGDYYYFKNDLKTSLKYYTLADQEVNGSRVFRPTPKNPKPEKIVLYSRKIKFLKDLLKD